MQENTYSKRIITIPNILTVFRMILIPVYIYLYSYLNNGTASAVVLIVAGLTDVLDGFIARTWHMESELGRVLDPVADKLMQTVMCISLSFKYPIFFWSLVFFAVKETTLLLLGYSYMKKTGIVNSARWYGKASSVVHYFVVGTLILSPMILPYTAYVLIWICMATHAVSLVLYIVFYIQSLRDPAHKPGRAMRPIDYGSLVMYLLLAASVFILLFTGGDSYTKETLWPPAYVFLRLASIVGVTGIPAFFLGEKMPREKLNPEAFPFRSWKWEKEGKVYEKVGIKWWKTHTPDMSKYMKKAFAKQGNMSRDPQHLKRLVLEMCSAELVHWLLILVSPLFAILIEGGWGKAVMVCYIISNLCSIMIQRYNRPRIQMIIKRIEKRNA